MLWLISNKDSPLREIVKGKTFYKISMKNVASCFVHIYFIHFERGPVKGKTNENIILRKQKPKEISSWFLFGYGGTGTF